MDRIARIIELERAAAKPEQLASATRWETAKLYWEEAHSGTTQTDIAAAVGKSRPHVSYMIKCWEITGKLLTGSLASFPDFQTVYRSSEVRGQSAENGTYGDGERRQRQPDDISTKVAKFGYLAGDIAGSIAATSWPGAECPAACPAHRRTGSRGRSASSGSLNGSCAAL